MNIKPAVYESLTPEQRLIATVEAWARGDKAEEDRLENSCPRKQYEQADFHYSGARQGIISASTMFELLITSDILSLMTALYSDRDEIAEFFTMKAVNKYTAWHRHLESMGIDPKNMDAVMKDIRHPLVDLFLKTDHEDMPKPDEEDVKMYTDWMKDFFKRLHNV